MIVEPVETVYAELANMTFDDVLNDIGDIGDQAGRGKAGPMNLGLKMCQYNEFFRGADQNDKVRKAYVRYAERANAANPYETVIDTGSDNEKSLQAQCAKLNLFVNIGGQIGGDEAVKLINDTIKLIKAIPGKKPSVYETVLKALRDQKKSKKPLDNEQLNELVNEQAAKAGGFGFGGRAKPADDKAQVTEESSLEELLKSARVHQVAFGNVEQVIKFLEDRLLAVRSTLVKKAA